MQCFSKLHNNKVVLKQLGSETKSHAFALKLYLGVYEKFHLQQVEFAFRQCKMFISFGCYERKFQNYTSQERIRASLVKEFIMNSKFKLRLRATTHQR